MIVPMPLLSIVLTTLHFMHKGEGNHNRYAKLIYFRDFGDPSKAYQYQSTYVDSTSRNLNNGHCIITRFNLKIRSTI